MIADDKCLLIGKKLYFCEDNRHEMSAKPLKRIVLEPNPKDNRHFMSAKWGIEA